jgi:DNA-binding GntR family transcriptional regulator
MIVAGELAVGSRILQQELAQRLGVSRTPMREALATLQSEGLVAPDTNRQLVVCRPSLAELHEIYEIREELEALAASHAANQREPDDIRELQRILGLIDQAPSSEDWVRLNAEFHSRLYAIARRAELAKLIDSLRTRTEVYVRILVGAGNAEAAQRDHRAIVAALEEGDSEAIANLVRAHLHRTRDRVAEVLGDSAETGEELLKGEA